MKEVNAGPRDIIEEFVGRLHRQGAHLRRALKGHHQKSFKSPSIAAKRLARRVAHLRNAHNPYSRADVLRSLRDQLAAVLGAAAPKYRLPQPVFFITVIDRRLVTDSTSGLRVTPEVLEAAREVYVNVLSGLDYIGMIEPALYVSMNRTHDFQRCLVVHCHVLAWGTSEAELQERRETRAKGMKAFLPYASAFDFAKVDRRDLHQMLWYVFKLPNQQYQLHRRSSGSFKQFDRKINGVNAVRVFHAMRRLSLADLALAGGQGINLMASALASIPPPG